ncbi:DUF4384 domain-containing protein [Phaeobacter sp. B1627]|uniref:DUF4384 domain-containing protein n=1 Tax=Phaeobacter sp. B1627 TaxID=2583809 RepID=UPI001119F416|nr:DUF4384 domain-containing protein [Phaeobacter sp. B1627]TNJ42323.1 DUF4384 domain-containing protein [Phaeobacter sp. B1627]
MTFAEERIGSRVGAASWGLGATGSLLVNIGLVACVIVSLRPQEIQDHDRPQSEFQVSSQSVPTSDAAEANADATDLPPAEGTSEPVASSAVRQSSAKSVPAENERIATASGSAAPIDATDVVPAVARRLSPERAPVALVEGPAAKANEVQAPATEQLQTAVPVGVAVAPVAASVSRPLAEVAARNTPLTSPLRLPSTSILSVQASDPRNIPPQETTARPLAETDPPAVPLTTSSTEDVTSSMTAAPPAAPSIRASLAFPATNASDVDPQSLAVFQQFQDPGSAGAALRDGLAELLSAIPCARVQLSFDPETASLELRGHLPEDSMRAPVLAALQTEMGQDIVLQDEMRLLPQPQCGALAGISDVGLPQSTDQITNPLLVGDDTHARVLNYAGGDQLFFDLTAPDYPAYVYVDYFDAGGSVLHLLPNAHVDLAKVPPMSGFRVGAKDASDRGLMITVGPPYGQEIAVAFAASHPLFPDRDTRPLQEGAAPYLLELKNAVHEARSKHPDFKGEWVYFLVTTHAP